MKVKVLKRFKDKYTGEVYDPEKNEIITISKERFEEILTVDKLVEAIVEDDATEESKPVKKTKKTTKKESE